MLACLKLHPVDTGTSSTNLLLSLGRLQQGQAIGNTVFQAVRGGVMHLQNRSFIRYYRIRDKPKTFHLLPLKSLGVKKAFALELREEISVVSRLVVSQIGKEPLCFLSLELQY